MKVFEILEKLQSTTSTKEKEKILKENNDNKLLEKLLYLTYDPNIQFYIKQIPDYEQPNDTECDTQYDLEKSLDLLELFYNRKVTGNEAKEKLSEILSKSEYPEIIIKVIQRDLKCGINSSTINKAFKNLITETPYMGAISYNKKKLENLIATSDIIFSQTKMDGRYCNLIVLKDDVRAFSRNGKENHLNIFKGLKNQIMSDSDEIVLNGELIIPNYDRYTSNGIISSILSINEKIVNEAPLKEIDKDIKKFHKKYKKFPSELEKEIELVVWDYIPYSVYTQIKKNECADKYGFKLRYKERLENLSQIIKNFDNISLIKGKIVKSFDEIVEHFKENLHNGEEGTIVKGNWYWCFKKPNHQIKFKVEETYDLKITGYHYGNKGTKNENFISSLEVKSDDEILVTNPAGINEKDMKNLTENKDKIIGKIAEVKCCGVSQDRYGNLSLLHPVFIKVRDDKDKAQSIKEILDITIMNIEMKDVLNNKG